MNLNFRTNSNDAAVSGNCNRQCKKYSVHPFLPAKMGVVYHSETIWCSFTKYS